MSIARLERGAAKVRKDLNHLCPCDSIDMQVLMDLKSRFLGGVFILPPALSSSSVSIDAHTTRGLSPRSVRT